MRLGTYVAALAAVSMATAPALAAPANPAASLSVAKSVRTGTKASKTNALAGGGVVIAIIASAALVAGIIILADKGDGADSG